jgi:hypothetical protein
MKMITNTITQLKQPIGVHGGEHPGKIASLER